MKKITRTIIGVLPLTAILLTVVEIILTNQLAGSGKSVRKVDLAIDVLRQQNDSLAQEVASASSLITIFSKARESGFIQPSSSQYLTIVPEQLPVAFRNPK